MKNKIGYLLLGICFLNAAYSAADQPVFNVPLTSQEQVNTTPSPKPSVRAVVSQQQRPVALNQPPVNNLIAFKNSNEKVTKEDTSTHVELSVDAGNFADIKSVGGEIDYRKQKWSLGVYGDSVTTKGTESILTGMSYGLAAHYFYFPYWYTSTKNQLFPGLYARVGAAKLTSSLEGDLPMYLTASVGADASYLLVKHVSLYGRIGLSYLYHESSVQFFGSELNFGLKIGF